LRHTNCRMERTLSSSGRKAKAGLERVCILLLCEENSIETWREKLQEPLSVLAKYRERARDARETQKLGKRHQEQLRPYMRGDG